ncbi:MAG: DUF4294 domain-containing protein [Bacteroidales bacterium]
MKKLLVLCVIVCAARLSYASLMSPKAVLARVYVDEYGDTIPHFVLSPVYCFVKPKFKSQRQQRNYSKKYARMVYNFYKVYPYAKMAKQTLAEMDAEFANIITPRERKAYINKIEKELFKEFEPIIRKMTISQGRMLIKLIDRETGRTGYQIVRELKGGFSAFFWQTVAVLFDSSLKSTFDADGNDKMLNQIILLYESGLL